MVEPPRLRPEEIGWYPNHSQPPKAEQRHRDSSDCDPPRRRGAWHPRRRLDFLRVRPFLGVYSVNNPPGYYPPDCLLHPQRTLRMAPYAPRRRRCPCLVPFGHETRYGRPDHIRMYFDDAIGSDDCPIHHVATLVTFFARLHLHKLKLSPDKSRIGAARVEFLGHVISADGVRPNDDRDAALTRMPMPTDIKHSAAYLAVLATTARSCPTWSAASAR